MSFTSNDGKCSVSVTYTNDMIHVVGKCPYSRDSAIAYKAAAPTDRRASLMGSGLPFANPDMAYQGTPNQGIVPIIDGKFQFSLRKPNSYYVKDGTLLIHPHVHVFIDNMPYHIPLGSAIDNRSLTGLLGQPNRTTRR
jgi:hypothetical protein